ncbi:MAG: hypothetical protein HY057_04870 [Rhodospirillales bacterium]|nr:hypothetical protein [Rhodospirillales bacterium]
MTESRSEVWNGRRYVVAGHRLKNVRAVVISDPRDETNRTTAGETRHGNPAEKPGW